MKDEKGHEAIEKKLKSESGKLKKRHEA